MSLRDIIFTVAGFLLILILIAVALWWNPGTSSAGPAVCQSQGDCGPGYVCDGQYCRAGLGTTCATTSDCASGLVCNGGSTTANGTCQVAVSRQVATPPSSEDDHPPVAFPPVRGLATALDPGTTPDTIPDAANIAMPEITSLPGNPNARPWWADLPQVTPLPEEPQARVEAEQTTTTEEVTGPLPPLNYDGEVTGPLPPAEMYQPYDAATPVTDEPYIYPLPVIPGVDDDEGHLAPTALPLVLPLPEVGADEAPLRTPAPLRRRVPPLPPDNSADLTAMPLVRPLRRSVAPVAEENGGESDLLAPRSLPRRVPSLLTEGGGEADLLPPRPLLDRVAPLVVEDAGSDLLLRPAPTRGVARLAEDNDGELLLPVRVPPLATNAAPSLLDWERMVIDVCSFSAEALYLLADTRVVAVTANQTTRLISAPAVRLRRLVSTQGFLHGLSDQGVLYRLSYESYPTTTWHWLPTTYPAGLVHVSATLPQDYLWLQTLSEGYLYHQESPGQEPQLVERVATPRVRVYGRTRDEYLELGPTSSILRPSGQEYPVTNGVLTYHGEVVGLRPEDQHHYCMVRLLNWQPYYILHQQ
jgi:hypothetical protein